MVKKLLLLVAVVVVAFFAVALFLPSSYSVERSIEIARPPEVVFEQVADFENWLAWNPFTETDPQAKNTITGRAGQPGAKWAWDGEEVGSGSLQIAEIDPPRSIRYDLAFTAPMESSAVDLWSFEPTANGTRVTWADSGELPYPIGRYFGLGLESMLGPQFEHGLESLKARVESLPETPAPMTPMMEEDPSGEVDAPPSL